MLSPSPSVLLWIGFYIATKQLMDIQKDLLGWLEEATLFPQPAFKQQPHSQSFFGDPLQLCFNDFIDDDDAQKNHKPRAGDDDGDAATLLDLPDVSDILLENGWMDEKFDLSILDPAQDDLLIAANNTAVDTPAEDLQLGSNVDYFFLSPDSLLPLDRNPKSLSNNGPAHFITQQILDTDSVSIASTSPEHVVCTEFGLQLPNSPSQSSCSSSSFMSGDVMSPPSNYEPSLSEVIEEACSSPVEYCVEVVVTEEQRSSSPEEINDAFAATSGSRGSPCRVGGKDMSQMRKSRKSSRQSCQPYRQKKETKYERKKVQNKEAAARYRVKRKEQDRILSDEVAELEAEQEKLQEKHDKLKSEITYLKSLMKELFQARGLIKKE